MPGLNVKQLTPDELQTIEVWHHENPGDFEHIDNYRYAHANNLEEELAYYEQQTNGCCGFVDVELTLPNGEILLYGFNYGH